MKRIIGIFTCFNRKEQTMECLRSLITGNPNLKFVFFAVDDASTDGTGEALRQFPEVEVINGNGKLYYCGGMRRGISAAKEKQMNFDYCLFFNDDVKFYPGAIEKMISLHKDEHQILVGATCDDKGVLSYGGMIKRSLWRPDFKIVMSKDSLRECDTFNANCVLIPYRTFLMLPNIDPVYTHSLGDLDYGLSARKKGYSILVSNFFVGLCNDNPVQGTWRDTKLSRKERLKRKENPKGLPRKEWYYFVRKHFGVISAWMSTLLPYIKIIIGK